MARIVNKEEYELKRNEILDAAQTLVYTKGFEQMSIQDILTDRQISKGAFYHYFDSKQALLEALIERMGSQIMAVISPIIQAPELPAIVKLSRFFDAAAQWKTARKDYLLSLMKIWYADENALVRQKVWYALLKQAAPILTEIICQGNQEGTFHVSYPEQACEFFFSLFQSMGESIVKMLFQPELHPDAMHRIETYFKASQDAIERILGAVPGSLQLFDTSVLEEWFSEKERG